VNCSSLNYKDGLCIGPGDAVVLTGGRVGEAHWGGCAQRARVRADGLVQLPKGLTVRQAMAIGTAGADHSVLPPHTILRHSGLQGIRDGPTIPPEALPRAAPDPPPMGRFSPAPRAGGCPRRERRRCGCSR
jgi:hypothetical protein